MTCSGHEAKGISEGESVVFDHPQLLQAESQMQAEVGVTLY